MAHGPRLFDPALKLVSVARQLLRPLTLAAVVGLLGPGRTIAAGSGVDLVVSTFDVEQPAAPGSSVVRSVRVTNRGLGPLTVRLEPRAVQLLDDGKTEFADTEDPLWAGHVTLSVDELTLAAGAGQDVSVQVAIPEDMPPDDYLLGLLVTPVPGTPTTMQVINSIGTLISIDVAGDRLRSLELVSHSLPPFVVGDQVTGTVRVKDTGTTLVSPWLEATAADALFGHQLADIQVRDQNRIGPGTSRDLSYTWNAGIVVGRFRVPVRVFYNRDNSTTAEIDVEDDLWLVHPAILGAIGLLLLAAIGAGGLLLWRRRRGIRAARPRASPEPPATT